ncbi:hypothetical protein H5410_030992 [Solanum commersonii]|uniref:Peptidase A2 domain-containing protein n=1 Tax=Solanum commersonii TaxID=4109 RepID=A0A9J5YKZ4_SOLCO|nr:hypothetical protein H5410_030992 [Solanum commersonii]
MEPPWVSKGRGERNNPRGRGRYSPSSSRSSSNTPIIQKGGMSLFNLSSKAQEVASLVHLEDILENNQLYAQLQAYLSQKQSNTFASIAKDDDDDYSESGSETDKPETSGNTQCATIDACKCIGDICSCEHDKFCKLQSQFEDMNINTITSNNVIELLEEVTDNMLRERIIQLASNNKASSSNVVERSKNEFEYSTPYSLSEVNNRLSNQHVITRDTSFDDLKGEIELLQQEIKSFKQNQIICDHRLTQIESTNNKAHKWYIKCTILIGNTFSITDIAMIGSGADVSCIQEGLVPTKYFEKVTHMNQLYPPIILGTPFINALFPFTNINVKGFSATYKDQDISYTFVTDPISHDINALINMKQKHVDSLQLELFSMNIFDTLRSINVQEKIKLISKQIAIDIFADRPSAFWNRKNHIVTLPYEDTFSEDDIPTKSHPCQMNVELVEEGEITHEEGEDTPQVHQDQAASSVHLEDIPENNPLYTQLQAYLSQEQSNTFASIAKDDVHNIKSYEEVEKREMIFLLENSEIQRIEEPWKIFQRYLLNGLYFTDESYKTRSYYENLLISTSVEFQRFLGYITSENVYNFSKMIIKQIISIEHWGISSMTERQFSLNKAFNKVLYYNYETHKHTWFIKVCAKIFSNPIPNWFLNWWSYYGPTIKILAEPILKLCKDWVKVSPDLNNLYHQEHICYMQQIEHIYFFVEFSVPWIHKWAQEVDFTEEQIPCLYQTYYNNFWDKLMKKDPQTKSLYGQKLLDLISKTIQDYKSISHKGIIADTSVRHMVRRISDQDEDDQNKMINNYLEEVKKSLLLNIMHYAKSDSSMRSETNDDTHEA